MKTTEEVLKYGMQQGAIDLVRELRTCQYEFYERPLLKPNPESTCCQEYVPKNITKILNEIVAEIEAERASSSSLPNAEVQHENT